MRVKLNRYIQGLGFPGNVVDVGDEAYAAALVAMDLAEPAAESAPPAPADPESKEEAHRGGQRRGRATPPS